MKAGLRLLLVLAALAPLWPLASQAQRFGEMKGFKFAEYYLPQQTQMKSLLEGATARRLDDGTIVVNAAKLQTFKSSGERELTVETPHCVHNPEARNVSSDGPLSAWSADGKFALYGEGFCWGQTNQWLIISNKVHTTIHGDLMAGPDNATKASAAGNTNAFDILSDSFEYRSETGLAIYRGHVRVVGTNVSLQSGSLTLELPMRERQLRNVSADEDVAMEYSGSQAWGQKATYDLETGVARITGEPRWQSEQRRGRAGEFLIDRTNKVVLATGHAWVSMPANNLGASALLNPPRSGAQATAPGTNQIVEISAPSYRVETNLIVFSGPVALTNLADGQARGSLNCGTLTATFAGTNQISTLTAEKGVVIRQEDNAISAARALYTATNNLLELTGDPAWRSSQRTGKGNVIFIDGGRSEMIVRGSASMRLPPNDLGARAGPGELQPAPATTATNTQPAEIFSQEYSMRADSASFKGGVYITHPRMAWACETMNIYFPEGGGAERKLVAENNVFFNFMDENGQKVNGSADKATYTYAPTPAWTNELVELTGNPVITFTNGTFRNRTILFDRARNKLIAPGRYVIRATTPGDTNSFKLPKDKWFK